MQAPLALAAPSALRRRLGGVAVVLVALAQPSCQPGEWLEVGTPAGEHAPSGALASVVRDSVSVTLVPTDGERIETVGALRAVVQAGYRVEGDTLRLALPTEADEPARAWLDGRELTPRPDTVARGELRPLPVVSDSFSTGPDPFAPEAVAVEVFETVVDGPGRVRVRYGVRPDREVRNDSPHGIHVVRLGWAPGVEGPRRLRLGGPEAWDVAVRAPDALADTLRFAYEFAEGADVVVVATRPFGGAGLRLVQGILLGLAVAACGGLGWWAGGILEVGRSAGWARVGEGVLRVLAFAGMSVAIAVSVVFVVATLASGLGPSGDSGAFAASARLNSLAYGVFAAIAGLVAALVAGVARWAWMVRSGKRP